MKSRLLLSFCSFLSLFFILITFSQNVFAEESGIKPAALLGTWDYVGFFYQGQRYQKPNDQLHVRFSFESESIVRLKWTRDEDQSVCERLAQYTVHGETLHQKVFWLNPDNSFECGKDPDMILNQESDTKISIIDNNELDLHLGLNGEEFIYILNRLK